jgi:hypothetical protein
MRLGIDLDNTIVNYDALFARLAEEHGLLPPHVAASKQAIRDSLRMQGREDRWTELQGIAYGSRMEEAVPFDGVDEFLRRCTKANIEWWIISHRTLQPYLGAPVDLHAAARQWLLRRGILAEKQLDRVKLAVSRQLKLDCIANTECSIFIDDLPELLLDDQFPRGVRRVLFDPFDQNPDRAEYERAKHWLEIASLLGV